MIQIEERETTSFEKLAAYYQEIAEQKERENAYLRGKIEEMDAERTWRTNLDRVPASVLSPSQKDTINRLIHYIDDHPVLENADGYTLLEVWRLAPHGEQSEGTLYSNINYVSTVHENGKGDKPAILPLFDKKIVHIPDPSIPRRYTEKTYIKSLALAHEPERYKDHCTTLRQHGGADRGQGRKPTCERCGRDVLEKDIVITKQRQTFCPRCQILHVDHIRQVNSPMLPTDDVPPGGGERNELITENQLDFQSPPTEEITEHQVDHVITTLVRDQVDVQSHQKPEEITENQLDFQSPRYPITPPPRLAIGEYPTNGFSLEEWLTRRIGHGPLIYSTGILDQARKYLTKPINYAPDIAAYLRGAIAHIYGSRPALPDDTTWLLGFDCDTPELDAQHQEWQEQLAAAGIPSVYWNRRPGRGHLEVYVDTAVDRKAFYAHLLSVCPGLAAIPECFPIGNDQNTGGDDRADFPYSWPLWYRVGSAVIECKSSVWCAGDPHPMVSPGISADRNRLTWLISLAMTPASLIPALPTSEEDVMPDRGGALLDIRPGRPVCSFDDGLGKAVIAAFNRQPWEHIVEVVDGWFRASWRKERTPSVKINADGTAHDFGRTGNYSKHFDKFEAYCLINQLDKSEELKRRIAEYKALEESIAS